MHVVARVPVGDDPHEVVASVDGRTAFVSNYGFGAFHSLTPVDLVAQKPLPSIDLGCQPHKLPRGTGDGVGEMAADRERTGRSTTWGMRSRIDPGGRCSLSLCWCPRVTGRPRGGAEPLGASDGYVRFRVGSGSYGFVARR